MKVYYWSPFISHVATVTSVINSVKAINKFSKKNIEVSIINVFNEWSPYNDTIIKNKIKILELNTFLDIKNLPKGSFLKSRLTYFITFIFSTFKLDKLLKEEKPDFLLTIGTDDDNLGAFKNCVSGLFAKKENIYMHAARNPFFDRVFRNGYVYYLNYKLLPDCLLD